jgi:transposase
VDEAGFYMLPCVVRTWSPIGVTPVLTTPCKYDHLSVAGALTREGRVLMKVLDRSFTGEDSVEFLKHILRQIKGKVIVIWDGAKIHHGEAVKEFLRLGGSRRLRLIRLPAYAPELNPAEGLWCWLKRAMGNICCENLLALRDELLVVLSRLRRRKDVLNACFQKAGLQI